MADTSTTAPQTIGPGQLLGNRYRLEQKIGEGGMGTVFLALDQELDRKVAIKILAPHLIYDAEVVERFEREARMTAKLDHPHIVPIYDVGRSEARPFIVMKKLEGDTLAGLLREKGGLTSDETLKLMRQLTLGLDFIHSKGFIHRDIKSGNIYVGPDGHATILDFGILRPRTTTQGLTRTGMVMGTPHYMAPEQALGARELDHRVDLYALAVVLFECLTGTLPFEAESELRLIQMQAHSPPPDLIERAPWISKPVAEVVKRALAKRPEDRYGSGAELYKALEAAYRDSKAAPVASAKPYTGPSEAPRTAPSWRNADPVPPPPAIPPVVVTPAAAPQPAGPVERPAAASSRPRVPLMVGVGLVLAAVLAALAFKPWEPKGPGLREGAGGGSAAVAVLAPFDAGAPAEDDDDGGVGALALLEDAGVEPAIDPPEVGPEQLAVALDAGAPPVAVKLRKGKLNVLTTHDGEMFWAQVSVDGVERGRSPLLLELMPGRYQVKVERTGFKMEQRQITVASGKQTVVRIDLTQ